MRNHGFKRSRFSRPFRVLAAYVCFCFFYEIVVTDLLRWQASSASAQALTAPNLVLPSPAFLPPALKAIHIDPQSPLEIDFIVDSADQGKIDQKEVNQLVQYFLATMTTPEEDLWVNLSPYEQKRIITPLFGETSAGRELLAQDNLLKQLAASLTYPESETGKIFWDRVYQKASAVYGTTAVPIDTFQRVWIMPQKAVVYEHNGTAFITESRLKVLLEEDYLALKNARYEEKDVVLSLEQAQKVNNFSSVITREIVLPEIEKEINEGRNFAPLRQIYHALILATWFKKKLKEHILARVYVDRKKVKGIEDDSAQTAEKIYQEYIQTLKVGVYNYVREDFDAPTQSLVPRQYFSGGFSVGKINEWLDVRPISNLLLSSRDFLTQLGRRLFFAKVSLSPLGGDGQSLPGTALLTNRPKKKAFSFNERMRRWAVGSLAGMMLAAPLNGVAQLSVEPAVTQTLAVTMPAPVETPNLNLVTVDDLDEIENRPVKQVEKVINKKTARVQLLQNHVTLADVIALHGKVNPITQKAYNIDENYFKNWNSLWYRIHTNTAPEWAKEVLVIAYQHKAGLAEDGAIGPRTEASLRQSAQMVLNAQEEILKESERINKEVAGRPILQESEKQKAAAGGPPPEQKTWFGKGLNIFNALNQELFKFFLTILIGLQTFRIYRDSKHTSTDRVELLRLISKHLKMTFTDMTSRVTGNQVEVIFRTTASVDKKVDYVLLAQKLIQEHAFFLQHGTVILPLSSVKRSETRLRLFFEMPKGEKVNGKGVTVFYRGEDERLKSFQMAVMEDSFRELEDEWENILRKTDQNTLKELSKGILKYLIEMIGHYRQTNPLSFKDFRNQAVIAFKLRKLAIKTLRKMPQHDPEYQTYRTYFYYLAEYGNLSRRILAKSATLDTYKSNFLPESDKLNRKFLGLSLDKIYRVVTMVEWAYLRVKNDVYAILPDFYNARKVLDQMETQLSQASQEETDVVSPSEYTIGAMRSEFDQFSMGFEKPYANSIVGLDLYRRHGKVMKSIRDIILLFSPFILWVVMGASLSIWVPTMLGILFFITANYLAPELTRFFTRYEYKTYGKILSLFKPQQEVQFMSHQNNKERLLQYMTRRFLPTTRWTDSPYVLAATQFSDIRAVRENSYIELRFVTDSHFMTTNAQADAIASQLKQAVLDGTLGFNIALQESTDVVLADRINIEIHPTGIRLRIKNVDVEAENISILYNGADRDSRKSYILTITNDPFKQLINQWDHVLEAMKGHDFSGLEDLLVSIREFLKPANINLADFRKNAGFYNLIRERAFATVEALVINGGRAVDPSYRKAFLSLAHFATEIRFLAANFAGMDALKFWYPQDGDLFNKKIFGIPVARVLRVVFGVSFLYSWTRTETLKSIRRVVDQWGQLDAVIGQVPNNTTQGVGVGQAIDKKLRAEFEKSDFSFRYPARNSLVGNDKHGRQYGMLVMAGFLLITLVTAGVLVLPFVFAATSFGFSWMTVFNLSIVFYLIAYWINPIHGINAMQRERNLNLKVIESYEKNSRDGELRILMNKSNVDRVWSNAFYYTSYVVGIFSPTVVMGYFLYQQIQSKFWKEENGNGNGNHAAHEKVVAAGGPDTPPVKGGIDLQVEDQLEVRGKSDPSFGLNFAPEILLKDLQGMKFHILELRPIFNPALFIPDFVKDNELQPIQMGDMAYAVNQ